MGEKRYQWYIDGVDIWDNQKEERIDDTPTLLNELSKENEQLKKENNILKASNGEYEDALARLEEENEQLKFKLEEVRSDEKQLGISFMEFKMKLIEKLQIHYDYATEQRQKNLDDIFVAKAYDIIRYDIKKLAEEMGVDLE